LACRLDRVTEAAAAGRRVFVVMRLAEGTKVGPLQTRPAFGYWYNVIDVLCWFATHNTEGVCFDERCAHATPGSIIAALG
jgi:hypothetical protein